MELFNLKEGFSHIISKKIYDTEFNVIPINYTDIPGSKSFICSLCAIGGLVSQELYKQALLEMNESGNLNILRQGYPSIFGTHSSGIYSR